jgi:Tfp pilus assembly protein PilO
MTLTDRDRKVLIFVVPVLAILAYWLLLLSPQREEADRAAEEVAAQQERRDTAQAKLDAARNAKQDFSADYTQIVRLGKAIPASVDMPSLIVQMDIAAEGTGIKFTKIKTGERVDSATAGATATAPPGAATSTTPAGGAPPTDPAAPVAAGGDQAQSAPGGAVEAANTTAQTANQQSAAAEAPGASPADTSTSTSSGGGLPVGGGTTAPGPATAPATAPAGLETVPLELEFTGNFFNLADFFHRVKRFVRVANADVVVGGRLLTVEGVRWSSDPEIFPKVRAELKATIYLSPKAQGATAGATPAGPTTTTPAMTTTPAQTAPDPAVAPTATATP